MPASSPSPPLDSSPNGHGFLPRWGLLALILLLIPIVITAVAGNQAPAVFQTHIYFIFILPLLITACMLGLALTTPFARRGLFNTSPWPDLYRALTATALGLGAFALATLLFGTLHLIQPANQPWPLLLIPLLAAIFGYPATRIFLRSLDRAPFTRTIHRGEYLLLLAAVPIAILLIAATFPPGTLWQSEGHGYDVLEYHLELPREYAANNSTAPLAHNVYSFLPANIEMLYLLLTQIAKSALQSPADADSSYLWGVFPSQFLHASLTLLSALALGLMPTPHRIGATARAAAIILFPGIPWTLVTGSLAYNEAGMLLFGTLALGVAFTPAPSSSAKSRALLLGILLGLAVGCKMTAGIFFAIPTAAIFLLRGLPDEFLPRLRHLALATAVAAALYLPWALRAALASHGNPLFPIAASILPHDDWTPEQVARFHRGHDAPESERPLSARSAALAHSSLLDPQWSPAWNALYEWSRDRPPVPTADDSLTRLLTLLKQVGALWYVVPLALILALARPAAKQNRSTTGLLLLVLVLQLLAWMFFTHLQPRFLLPIAIPLALLVGQGGGGEDRPDPLAIGALRLIVCTVIALHTLTTVFLLLPEAMLFGGIIHEQGRPVGPPPPIGELFSRQINLAALVEHPNSPSSATPPGKILLIGDSAALHFDGQIVYNTVFDHNLLADALRAGGPPAALHWLQQQHINYILINWTEIARLRNSYGFDDAITPESIDALAHLGLTKPTLDLGPNITLLQLPPHI